MRSAAACAHIYKRPAGNISLHSLTILFLRNTRQLECAPMGKAQKITVTPVSGLPDPFLDEGEFNSQDLPFEVGPGVYLADISEQMKEADYSLWAREYLSTSDVKKIRAWHYALVNYYNEEEYAHTQVQESSRELVHRVFLGLRIVRPSWVPYQYLHAQVRSDGSFDPSGFSQAQQRLTVPFCDSLTPVRRKDAELLKAIVPVLLRAYETDCEPVKRAIRILELGYISEFPDVKQLMWVTGLDALFTSTKNWGASLAIRRIEHFLGPETPIYEQADFPSYVLVPTLSVKEVLPDIYRMRNKFAHGEWVPNEYLKRGGYSGKAGEALSYADVLLEATSIVFRLALTKILKHSLLDTFGTKDELDWYFSRFGLVRKRKSCRGLREMCGR